MSKNHGKDVKKYINDVMTDKRPTGKYEKLSVKRYLKDLENKEFIFKPKEADELINIIEDLLILIEGEDMDGKPFKGRPFLLRPWQKFIIYNLEGFYYKKNNLRRFIEALVCVPKKTGKTPFAAGLGWAFGYKYASSMSKVLFTSNTMRQALFPFHFLKKNLLYNLGVTKDEVRIIDNNMSHSIEVKLPHGEILMQSFSGDPVDGVNGNFVISDEVHAFKKEEQYSYYYKAMKAYRNKLMLAITTTGESLDGFFYTRLETCKSILDGVIKDESYFIYYTHADKSDDGVVDILSPIQHEKANPNYGITISPAEMVRDAKLASVESKSRNSYIAKDLNIYVQNIKSYFNIDVFRNSDELYNWTMEELSKLDITWFGGTDLSEVKDLTATCLYANYEGVDILIPHAFFPITRAEEKVRKDDIELFAWLEDGFLTMCNSNTINISDVINWFIKMRDLGFRIKEVRYDRRFGEEFIEDMKAQKFNVKDQSQKYVDLTKAFNRIDRMSEEKKLYYLHSEAYEYCVNNVYVLEKPGGFKQYDKLPSDRDKRIDLFAASVFACNGLMEKSSALKSFNRIAGVK